MSSTLTLDSSTAAAGVDNWQKAQESIAANNNWPDLTDLDAIQRIKWAHEKFGDGLVLTSSFGVQSVVMIELMHRSGIDIPVISIEPADEAHRMQSKYRETLAGYYRFKSRPVLSASGDDMKLEAMNWALKNTKATAVIDGIRWAQTDTRKGKVFIETRPDGIVQIHPILDWSNPKIWNFIEALPNSAIHPAYSMSAQSKGGRVLKDGEVKVECGWHVGKKKTSEPEYYI